MTDIVTLVFTGFVRFPADPSMSIPLIDESGVFGGINLAGLPYTSFYKFDSNHVLLDASITINDHTLDYGATGPSYLTYTPSQVAVTTSHVNNFIVGPLITFPDYQTNSVGFGGSFDFGTQVGQLSVQSLELIVHTPAPVLGAGLPILLLSIPILKLLRRQS
jgi:hypothetical protein